MKAVVLAGGRGTRLSPHTKILPKPLMPIGDMSILEVIIRQMKRREISEIILTVGHLAQLLYAFFEDGSRFGIPIRYSYEEEPLGTAGPLAQVQGLERTFVVSNGDVLTTLDIRSLIDFHKRQGAAATIAMHQRKVNIDLGVIKLNGQHEIIDYMEKPSFDYEVSMGIYVFEPTVLQYIPRGHHLDFPDLVLRLLSEGQRVIGFPFEGYWKDLGREDDYDEAASDFETMRAEFLGTD